LQVNCGALTDSLLESELFGYERGSFTGAHRQTPGLFEAAHGGTLLLDELEAISHPMQVRLLRVLEQGQVQRIGGRDLIPVDVRIVAATNESLEVLVEQGRLREDLYYRLNVVPVRLPPLRERLEDIPLLVGFFLHRCAEANPGMPRRTVSPEAMRVLREYSWPGNVCELKNLVERLWLTTDEPAIGIDQLPRFILFPRSAPARATRVEPTMLEGTLAEVVQRATEQVEREYLVRALSRFQGRIEQTARHAGITRRTLYSKMKAYNISKEAFKGSGRRTSAPDDGDCDRGSMA
jgi:DNA-binding NtrC family response regulator